MSRSFLFRAPAYVYAALLFGLGLLAPFLMNAAGLGRDPAAVAAAAALMFALVTPAILLYWRRLDEAAREAHKFAWYWGGSAGIVVIFVVFVGLTAPGASPIPSDFLGADSPRDLFAYGMIATLMAQVAGYTIAWAGWWIARR